MTYFTGRNGKMVVGGSTIAKVTSWSMNADLDLLETTALNDANKSFVANLPTYTGSATILYYKDAAGAFETDGIFGRLLRRNASLATATLRLQVADGNIIREVVLEAFITSLAIGSSVGEIVSADINFQATGDLADPTAQTPTGVAL